MDKNLHEKWAKNKKKVEYVTSNPEILCKKFIELNKLYLIPNFKYSNKIKKNLFIFNLKELKSENKYALNCIKTEIKQLNESAKEIKNNYNIFCMKSLHYLKEENCINDYKEPVEKEDLPWYIYLKKFKTSDVKSIKRTIKSIINFTLLSLYFSNFQYLFNLLTYDEVKKLVKDGIIDNYFESREEKVIAIAEKLCNKLRKNESILNEKNDIKEIQIYSIYFSTYAYSRDPRGKSLFDFYQILNFLRDVDFSLKLLLYFNYIRLNNKNHYFVNDLVSSLISSEIRFNYFNSYILNITKPDIELNELDKRNLNDSLEIKDFLIIGNISFQQKIKFIEKQNQ